MAEIMWGACIHVASLCAVVLLHSSEASDAPDIPSTGDAELDAKLEAKMKELTIQREQRRAERKKRRNFDPAKMAHCDFSTEACWEQFYGMHEGNYEWYQVPVDVLEPHLKVLPGDLDLLHVGCGSSSWTGDLGKLPHVRSVVNCDLNAVAIERMREMYSNDTKLSFQVEDASNLTFADETFDVVLDKGLLDVFRPRGMDVVVKTAMELKRTLRPGGLLIYVSYSGEERQAEELREACKHHEAPNSHLYVCRWAGDDAGDQADSEL
eukprot:gnl/MRDRNA2_/MRDRNA2_28575_c0_seq1.p1 gnl/MRDRNA2_/MRDRNA2_28575_c0~~gnl/MRDRNA2_/MRDRNA2_28575_c0_seq1.p1  ORF type:complete len:266 (+),score=57.48 gnl/MRDRNA2_/MRDRNA2_28575_c0_seq1:71-868(+)